VRSLSLAKFGPKSAAKTPFGKIREALSPHIEEGVAVPVELGSLK